MCMHVHVRRHVHAHAHVCTAPIIVWSVSHLFQFSCGDVATLRPRCQVISIGILLEHSAYPDMAVLERSQYGTIQNAEHWEKSKPIPNTCMVRIDASLFFTNVERFKAFLLEALLFTNLKHPQVPLPMTCTLSLEALAKHDFSEAIAQGQYKWLLIDFKGVNDIDFMGLHMIEAPDTAATPQHRSRP